MKAASTDGRSFRHLDATRRGAKLGHDELCDWPVIRRWLRDQDRRGLRPLTITKRRTDMAAICRWAHPRSLFDFDREDVEEFLDSRRLSPRTRYAWLSTLETFYDWAIDEDITKANPAARIRRPKMRRSIPRPISSDDLEHAMGQADPKLRALMALAAWEGLRCGEIANLQRQDILDTHEPPLLVVSDGKGGHQRILPLNPDVLVALRLHGLPARNGFVFPSRSGRRAPAYEVSHAINRHLEGLGIEATAHMLRHWFGTSIYAATRDIRVTQELMGHQSPNTTAGYVAWSPVDAAAAVQGLTDQSRRTA